MSRQNSQHGRPSSKRVLVESRSAANGFGISTFLVPFLAALSLRIFFQPFRISVKEGQFPFLTSFFTHEVGNDAAASLIDIGVYGIPLVWIRSWLNCTSHI